MCKIHCFESYFILSLNRTVIRIWRERPNMEWFHNFKLSYGCIFTLFIHLIHNTSQHCQPLLFPQNKNNMNSLQWISIRTFCFLYFTFRWIAHLRFCGKAVQRSPRYPLHQNAYCHISPSSLRIGWRSSTAFPVQVSHKLSGAQTRWHAYEHMNAIWAGLRLYDFCTLLIAQFIEYLLHVCLSLPACNLSAEMRYGTGICILNTLRGRICAKLFVSVIDNFSASPVMRSPNLHRF